MTPKPQDIANAFATLEDRASCGERCPENGSFGISTAVVGALARMGRIRVEISGHNWRRVILLEGPHAGTATAPDPTGARAWKIIDAAGTTTNGKLTSPSAGRTQPSAPRPLTAEELKR